jgi:hypothetical protein
MGMEVEAVPEGLDDGYNPGIRYLPARAFMYCPMVLTAHRHRSLRSALLLFAVR